MDRLVTFTYNIGDDAHEKQALLIFVGALLLPIRHAIRRLTILRTIFLAYPSPISKMRVWLMDDNNRLSLKPSIWQPSRYIGIFTLDS